MKINQLSLFLENKPGRLSSPLKALAAAGIKARRVIDRRREKGLI